MKLLQLLATFFVAIIILLITSMALDLEFIRSQPTRMIIIHLAMGAELFVAVKVAIEIVKS